MPVNRRAAKIAAAPRPPRAIMSAPSVPAPIAALDLPAEVRSLLRLQTDINNAPYISMTYANLSAYYKLHPNAPVLSVPRRRQSYLKPVVNIDATIPTHLTHDTFDILPYIFIHTRYPHIHFDMRTSKSDYHATFHAFLKWHVQNKFDAWAELLSCGSVQEVMVYCKLERTVDIILKPGSKLANEYHCDVEPGKNECAAAAGMRRTLGLTGMNGQVWLAYIIVGSVEG